MKRALVVVSALAVVSCAAGRAERIAKLSDDSRQLFARYHQFMTERQTELFLDAKTDLERKHLVDGLKIDDMLSQFPKPVQDAIWAQSVMLGMDKAAVLLSWGSPRQTEFDEDRLGRGNQVERWYYQRSDKNAFVTFTNGVVSDYDDGSK